MVDNSKTTYVTRQEFNSQLGVVWVYITLTLGAIVRTKWDWYTGFLEFLAFLMVFAYLLTPAIIANRTAKRVKTLKLGMEASERVKEIARDPARKIEAIKVYREETGAGLAEAKEVVEAYISIL